MLTPHHIPPYQPPTQPRVERHYPLPSTTSLLTNQLPSPEWDNATILPSNLYPPPHPSLPTTHPPSPEWDDISPAAKDLIRKLLAKDPRKRPTAAQVNKWERGRYTHM